MVIFDKHVPLIWQIKCGKLQKMLIDLILNEIANNIIVFLVLAHTWDEQVNRI